MGGLFLFSTLELPRTVEKGKRKGKMESKERKERGKSSFEMFEVKVKMWRMGVIYCYTSCNPLIHHYF